MGQEAAQDPTRPRMALPTRVQPLLVACMDAYGTLAVLQGRLRRGCINLRLYVAALSHAACHIRQGARLACQVLHRGGVELRCRGCDTCHKARLYTLGCTEGVGLYAHRLLSAHSRLCQRCPISAPRHTPRDATQAACTRMVHHGTDTDPARQQDGCHRCLSPCDKAESALRGGVQRTYSHDRGDVGLAVEQDDSPTQAHGGIRQEQGISRPGVLRHRQHLYGAPGYCKRHLGL